MAMAKKPNEKWTEAQVFAQLRHVFPSPAFVRLPQVRNGTGYARKQCRTADAIVASVYPSRGLYLTGVEIKISKSDWRSELANPNKADEIGKYCRRWYIAAPAGVVPPAELPPGWGLVEVTRSTATIHSKGSDRNCSPPDMLLLCSILRSADKCMIQKDEASALTREAQKQSAAEIEKAAKDHCELIEIKHTLQNFEDASGLPILSDRSFRWNCGKIGEAVKIITEAGSPELALKKLRDDAEAVTRVSKRINKILDEVDEQVILARGADA